MTFAPHDEFHVQLHSPAMRESQRSAYGTILLDGLLAKRRAQAYAGIYKLQFEGRLGVTSGELDRWGSEHVEVWSRSFSPRLSELVRLGVIAEMPMKVECSITKMQVIGYVTTGELPAVPERVKPTNVTFEIAEADAFAFLAELEDESIDLIVIDPPYESLEKHRKTGTTTRLKHSKSSSNDWFVTVPNSKLPELMRECYRVLKKDRHCYVMCDQETMFHLKPAGEAAGFKFWKPVVWDKMAMGMGYHYRAQYELILFFEKGKRKLNNLGIPDVLSFKRIKNKKAYPTEKPFELIDVFVTQSVGEGSWVVLDCFMGSGVVGAVALEHGCHFIGCDINPDAYDLTERRLEALL